MSYSTSTTIIYGRKLEPKDCDKFHELDLESPLIYSSAGHCHGGDHEIFVGVYAITLHEDDLSISFNLTASNSCVKSSIIEGSNMFKLILPSLNISDSFT